MKTSRIATATRPEQIRRCHVVMRELRPHFDDAEKFVERVTRQQKEGYLLAFLEAEGEVRAVAGYRFLESLFPANFFTWMILLRRLPTDHLVSAANFSIGWSSRRAPTIAKI